MNSEETPSFTISQDMDISQPQKASAFAIANNEWSLLKQSVESIEDSNSFFHTIGSALIGGGISTIISVFFTSFPEGSDIAKVIMWSVAVVCCFCGCFSLILAHKEKSILAKSTKQVLSQMEVIETRFGGKT